MEQLGVVAQETMRGPDAKHGAGPAEGSVLRLALLASRDGELGTTRSLSGMAGLELVIARSVSDLLARAVPEGADAVAIDAVAIDPELGEGWPADTAERVVTELAARVPVAILCRSREDAEQIEHRVASTAVSVLLEERCSPRQLVAHLEGLIAGHRGRAPRF